MTPLPYRACLPATGRVVSPVSNHPCQVARLPSNPGLCVFGVKGYAD